MNKSFICNVSEEDSKKLLEIYEMKNTLESLIMQIAGNNDILKEDSLLYSRLVDDYTKNMRDYNKFWTPYTEKYADLLNQDTQLSIDFRTNEMFLIPKGNNIGELGNA